MTDEQVKNKVVAETAELSKEEILNKLANSSEINSKLKDEKTAAIEEAKLLKEKLAKYEQEEKEKAEAKAKEEAEAAFEAEVQKRVEAKLAEQNSLEVIKTTEEPKPETKIDEQEKPKTDEIPEWAKHWKV